MTWRKSLPVSIVFLFLIFGFILGLLTIGYYNRYDSLFFLNLPGYVLGEAFHGVWHRFFDSSFWLIGIPQVYVLSSLIFWGTTGFLLTRFFKPVAIAWIAGIYVLIFGGLSLAVYLG